MSTVSPRSLSAMTEKITTAHHAATISAQTFQHHLHRLTVLSLLQHIASLPITRLAVTTLPDQHGTTGIFGQIQRVSPNDTDPDAELQIQQSMMQRPVPLDVYREFDDNAATRSPGQASIVITNDPAYYEDLIQQTLQVAWHHLTVFRATDSQLEPPL